MKDVRKFIPKEPPLTLGGEWKGETDILGTLRQVLVMPESNDTMYDIGIKDENGMLIFVRYDVIGPLVTENLGTILFPGSKFIIIENATKDEDFKLKLTYQL